MDSISSLLLVMACLILEALFSGGELALVSSDINRVRYLARKGDPAARRTLRLLEKPERFLATTLAGTNLCVITATATATAFFISHFGAGKGEILSVLVMVPTMLFLGEIIPKTVFHHNVDRVALRISGFIWIVSLIFYPLVLIITRITRGTAGGAGKEKDLASSCITKSGLRYLLKSRGSGSDMLAHEQAMVQRILDFSELNVGRVMVGLSTMTVLPASATMEEAAGLFAEKKYLRIPVYRNQTFNIVGIIHYHDLLHVLHNQGHVTIAGDSIEGLIQDGILFVPENKLAKELLLELRERGEQLAIVVDEYGGAVGMVTTEDILAEIVGELDERDAIYRKIAPGRYIFQAQVSLEKINQLLPVSLPVGDYETLGGFLLARMGKIPRRRETLQYGQVRFIIEDADPRSIREVMTIFPPELEKDKDE
ncbi:MAG: hemolysin family protein [Smithellaceae bacterium]|nr:hemolysin family protein [Smithellaceae bacterium]